MRRANPVIALSLLLLGALAVPDTLSAQQPGARILVGPNLWVGIGGPFPHVETFIAAHPTDPQKLLAGAMGLGDPGAVTRIFASADGGATWWRGVLPEQVRIGGDPMVAFTPRGTAISIDLGMERLPNGRPIASVYVWRSEDGGRTWQKPAILGEDYDHPWIAIAPDGRIYISVVWGGDSSVGVLRSDDDGRTFTSPVRVAAGGEQGANISTPLVLSDGTLLFTWFEFPYGHSQPGQRVGYTYRLAASSDGGKTFSAPLPVVKTVEAEEYGPHHTRLSGFVPFAVDRSAGPFRDRIYFAWTDYRTGRARVHFIASSDRGKTWSEPRALGTSVPAHAHTYQPVLAVNKEGVLGVTWLDTRASQDGTAYDLYFAASLDGGASFLPEVRVSSETSQALGAGNLQPETRASRDRKGVRRLFFTGPAARYPQGGDYMGLTADARGDFHPFWADARTGTWQPWTSRIRVTTGEPPAPASRERIELGDRIEMIVDQGTYDGATRELRVPLRLRNTSARPIYGPLHLEVKGFGRGSDNLFRDHAPEVLNATNGKAGVGAILDLTPSLGDFEVLEPGAVSGAVVLRLRMAREGANPDVQLEVFGEVETVD